MVYVASIIADYHQPIATYYCTSGTVYYCLALVHVLCTKMMYIYLMCCCMNYTPISFRMVGWWAHKRETRFVMDNCKCILEQCNICVTSCMCFWITTYQFAKLMYGFQELLCSTVFGFYIPFYACACLSPYGSMC